MAWLHALLASILQRSDSRWKSLRKSITIWGWVGPIADLAHCRKAKFLSLLGIKCRESSHPCHTFTENVDLKSESEQVLCMTTDLRRHTFLTQISHLLQRCTILSSGYTIWRLHQRLLQSPNCLVVYLTTASYIINCQIKGSVMTSKLEWISLEEVVL